MPGPKHRDLERTWHSNIADIQAWQYKWNSCEALAYVGIRGFKHAGEGNQSLNAQAVASMNTKSLWTESILDLRWKTSNNRTGRQADRQTNGQVNKQTNRQASKQASKQANKQTKQTSQNRIRSGMNPGGYHSSQAFVAFEGPLVGAQLMFLVRLASGYSFLILKENKHKANHHFAGVP